MPFVHNGFKYASDYAKSYHVQHDGAEFFVQFFIQPIVEGDESTEIMQMYTSVRLPMVGGILSVTSDVVDLSGASALARECFLKFDAWKKSGSYENLHSLLKLVASAGETDGGVFSSAFGVTFHPDASSDAERMDGVSPVRLAIHSERLATHVHDLSGYIRWTRSIRKMLKGQKFQHIAPYGEDEIEKALK